MTRLASWLLVALLVTLTSGCELAQDDEMAPKPTRTVTRSPSPQVSASVPTSVPTGEGDVSPSWVVWAQGSKLHFGTRQVDVAPLRIDSFVVVPGGVFFVSMGELWFTDLSRARATGLTDVTRVSTTPEADALRVELSTGSGAEYAYDLDTGEAMPPAKAVPATDADLRGPAKTVVLRPAGDDGPDDPVTPVKALIGPGSSGFGIVGGNGEPLVVFDTVTRERIPLAGVAGSGFKLVRWQGKSDFFGLALGENQEPLAVQKCSLDSRRCTTVGKPDPGSSPVFESAA